MSQTKGPEASMTKEWNQTWFKPGQKPKKFYCHVCQKDTKHNLLLKLVNIDPVLVPQEVYSCPTCKVVVIRGDKRAYPASDHGINASLYNMPGLDVMSLSAGLAKKYGAKTFLDVGANYGFAMDIAKYGYDLDSEGIEPTDARLRAKKHFDTRINDGYMNIETNLGKKFDFIHSSEVLEHVPDPLEFLQALYNNLTSRGFIFLTTPWAGVASPKNDPGTVISNLSPSDHIYIWSEFAVTKLLKQVGFQNIYVEVRDGHHVYVIASKSKSRTKLNLKIPDDDKKLLNYMIKRSKTAKSKIARLSMLTGAFFIANEERDYDLCSKLLPRLLRLSKSCLGIDLGRPTRATVGQINKLDRYAPRVAALCYIISTLHILHTGKYSKAVEYCELGIMIISGTQTRAGYSDYISTLHDALLDTLITAKKLSVVNDAAKT